ncbi:PAS domain-containing sensor histidine kinase [Lutimonas zeaxanthinifaciens]|uniref:PAS domain-containing sensor histidine kinase n=1 Tax=Lutimonas zeaxanthinifaciens TaxID=3060215 RepID=UPI00265CF786|nr:PAS domain-containing protein [Lutimonas sp. YSD2104]WKK65741.1 PAS domain-containing protein [Lutimonas sp. YSD2104]
MIFKNQEKLYERQANRYYSYRLGDELRQTDDYLTEYCKNFVITGDSIWEKRYWDLVAKREGKAPLRGGANTSLLDSMQNMGFSDQEFDLLKLALQKSNQLVKKESIAFNAAKGIFLDSVNEFSIRKEPNIEFALQVLHDKEYLLMKKEIMEPIIKFESLIESRTKATVDKYNDKSQLLLILTILSILIAVFISIIAYNLIIKRLAYIEDLANELRLKTKEQACLFKISQLTESTGKSIEHVLESAVSIIPFGWKYPENTSAQIDFKGNLYSSVNFTVSPWTQEATIRAEGKSIGTIKVFVQKDGLSDSESPFLDEEIVLIESIASLISSFYERKSFLDNLSAANEELASEISYKIETEKELKKSDERFKLATQGSNAGIWDLDVASRIAYWSPLHYEILGYSPGEFTPTLDFVRSIVHEDDRSIFDEIVQNHVTKGTALDFEARFFTKQKEVIWCRSIGASSRDKNGKSVRIVGTFVDITDKKMAEKALADKEQQLQFALDASNEGIWEINGDCNYIDFSDRCYTMLGYIPVQDNSKQFDFWKRLVSDESQSKALINQIAEIKLSGFHDGICRMLAENGEYKWIHTKGKAVEFSEDNKPLRIVGTMTDITERMRQEEKIVSTILETEDKERSRIAREIHDGLQQTMSTSLMSLEKVRSSTDFENEDVYERFHMGYKFLKKAIEESRNLAHNLMPKVVDENGIVKAIHSLISAIQNSSETIFYFDDNLGEERLKLSYEMTLYRITQEAINNVIKYANATKCNIQLLKHSNVLMLTIEDNGEGFDAANTINTFGINSMRTRAESIGGFFEINSQPHKGTQIFVELPLN